MKNGSMKSFLISCIFWLMPGLAAGILSAAFLCMHEYHTTARLVGALQEGEQFPAVLKSLDESKREEKTRGVFGNDDGKEKDFEEEGMQYLEKFGHREFRKMWEYLPFTFSINLILFEAAGCMLFWLRKKEKDYNEGRIVELTEYLKSVDRGEAAVLTRHEDSFSHLEDEIYKTVAELTCTKEKAVKDHEILAARIADIAHQLKTPLTSMSLMTELLEPAKKEEQEYLDRLKHQVERLKSLVEGLLELAKLDSHTIEFQREVISLEDLIWGAVEPIWEQLDRRSITLEMEETEELWIKADIQWTTEAFLNVLKNCMEHTPDEGKIKITCSQNPLYTEFVIEDGGNGFSRKDLPHLFERFYRGEQAAKDSAGIGLALAKLILEAQNGQITAENSESGHARFRIKIYAS